METGCKINKLTNKHKFNASWKILLWRGYTKIRAFNVIFTWSSPVIASFSKT